MTNGENIIEDLRKMAEVSEEDFVDSFTDDYRVVYKTPSEWAQFAEV